MGNAIKTKICGLTEPRHVQAAVAAGAAYLGFNFFEKSPRFLPLSHAGAVIDQVPAGVARVALFVNPDDVLLDQFTQNIGVDFLQLHGHETPERVAQIRDRYGLPVIKAVGVADAADLPALVEYGRVADQLLVDAKPAKGAELLGGNGVTFDWRLIAGRRWPVPWLLAGGLTPQNVVEAIKLTGAQQVDVSSGVETAPGVKSAEMIKSFIAAAQVA